MCGIAGIFSSKSTDFLKSEIKKMINTLPHRGPDDQGICTINGLAFGHVRLAIQDLSPNGKQPMLSTNLNPYKNHIRQSGLVKLTL